MDTMAWHGVGGVRVLGSSTLAMALRISYRTVLYSG